MENFVAPFSATFLLAKTRLTIKVLFILYFVSDPELESELELELIRSLESELEQPHGTAVGTAKLRALSEFRALFLEEHSILGRMVLLWCILLDSCGVQNESLKKWVPSHFHAHKC